MPVPFFPLRIFPELEFSNPEHKAEFCPNPSRLPSAHSLPLLQMYMWVYRALIFTYGFHVSSWQQGENELAPCPSIRGSEVYFIFKINFQKHLFVYLSGFARSSLQHVGPSIFTVAREIFSCSMWDLVPWPGMESGSPALGAQSLSHWTTKEVPEF